MPSENGPGLTAEKWEGNGRGIEEGERVCLTWRPQLLPLNRPQLLKNKDLCD